MTGVDQGCSDDARGDQLPAVRHERASPIEGTLTWVVASEPVPLFLKVTSKTSSAEPPVTSMNILSSSAPSNLIRRACRRCLSRGLGYPCLLSLGIDGS